MRHFFSAEQARPDNDGFIPLVHAHCVMLRVKITPLSSLVNQSNKGNGSSKMKIST